MDRSGRIVDREGRPVRSYHGRVLGHGRETRVGLREGMYQGVHSTRPPSVLVTGHAGISSGVAGRGYVWVSSRLGPTTWVSQVSHRVLGWEGSWESGRGNRP